MGTVKYTGPMASFHCPTNAEIRSLKVHFSPKQEGSGDPSPENVRQIVGWDGVEVQHKGKNLYRSEYLTSSAATYSLTRTGLIVSSTSDGTYRYVLFKILDINENNIGQTFTFSAKCISATNAQRIILSIRKADGSSFRTIFEKTNNYTSTFTIPSDFPIGGYLRVAYYCTEQATSGITEYGDIQLELGSTATSYESYCGETTDYEFGVLGKNKFDKNGLTPIGAYIDNSGNLISSTASKSFIIPVAPNTQYTISKIASTRFAIGQSSKNIPEIGDILTNPTSNSQGTSISFTTTATTKSIVAWVYIVTDTVSYNDIIDSIQLELGSTATTYEPYDPNHTVYGGWVDLISGEVCEMHTGVLYDGSIDEDWQRHEAGSAFTFAMRIGLQKYMPDSVAKTVQANYLVKIAGGATWGNYDNWISSNRNNVIITGVQSITTVENWRTYLSEHNLFVVYQLATPNTYSLAPTQLQTFLGQNNVWSNADYVEVEYDLHETQDILARKQFIIANQPHIVKPAAAPLQNFKTDVPTPLKECKVYFNPIQAGTGDPSPNNIRQFTEWNGIEVYSGEENLVTSAIENNNVLVPDTWCYGYACRPDNGKFINGRNYITNINFNNNNFSYHTGEATSYGIAFCKNVSENETIIIKFNSSNGRLIVIAFNSSNEFQEISLLYVSSGSYPITIPSGINKLFINFTPATLQDKNSTITFTDVYIGSTHIIPITFPTENGPFYKGYIDLVKGELVQTYESKIFTGNESFGATTTGKIYIRSKVSNNSDYAVGGAIQCSHFPRTSISTSTTGNGVNIGVYSSSCCIVFRWLTGDSTEIASTAEAWQTYFAAQYEAGTPVRVIYKLTTPKVYQITPQTIKTLRGTNNIWASNNGENIEVSFWGH